MDIQELLVTIFMPISMCCVGVISALMFKSQVGDSRDYEHNLFHQTFWKSET